jgi:hypothetical protein
LAGPGRRAAISRRTFVAFKAHELALPKETEIPTKKPSGPSDLESNVRPVGSRRTPAGARATSQARARRHAPRLGLGAKFGGLGSVQTAIGMAKPMIFQ